MTSSSNCPTEAALIDYAANRATPDDTDRIDTHLTLCHKCRAAIEWLRAHNILRAHSSDNSADDSISRDLSGASASIGGGGNGDGGDNSSDHANPLEEASTKSGSNPVSGASASGGENRPDDASPSGGSSSSGSSNSSDGASASANSPSRSSEGAAESGAGKREGGQLSYHIPGGVEVTSEHLPPLFDRRILSPAGDPKAMGRLGKYDVFKILGQGGFGSVLEGFDPHLQRKIAIKVLNSSLATNRIARLRFIREAQAAAAINHSHIVTIHAVEVQPGPSGSTDGDDSTPFLVMEYLGGATLRERLETGPKFSLLELIRISAQIASGLAAAHAKGVIHRDIKPGNIMFEDGVDRVKITDFGLARVAMDKVELTSHESALGTPAYMSPEQLRGEKLDPRTDLFSLGCVLFAMVTGNSPFYGKSTFEVTTKVATMFPRPLREIDPAVPDFFSDLVESLLDKRADRRPPSAQEVADLLNQQLAVLNQTPTDKLSTLWPKASSEPFDTGSAATLDLPVRPGSRHAKSAGDPADGAKLAPSARVNPWVPAIVTTAVALAAMVALFFAFRQDGKGAGTGGMVEVPPEKPGTGSPPKSPTRKSLVLVGNAVVEEGDLKVDCRTIGEALRLVAPGGVIRVIDEFEYREAVVIDDAERHRGISIVSDREAILAPPNGAPPTAATLRIIDVPEVTLKGLTIQGEGLRAAVSIEGRSQGCKLEGVKCSVLGAGGPSAMILLRPTGMTANDSPIVVSGCVVEASPGAAGVRVQTDKGAGAVELRRCTVRNGTTGIHVVADVAAPPGRLKIERCDLIGVQTGVLLEWAAPPPADGLQLLNNTIVAADSWLQIAPTPAWPKTVPGEAPMQSIGAIVNNLAIGGAAKLRGEFQNARAAELFVVKSNWRAPSDSAQAADAVRVDVAKEGTSAAEAAPRGVAPAAAPPTGSAAGTAALPDTAVGWETLKSLDELRLWNVAPHDYRYLRPAYDSPLLDSGAGGEFPKFIGAAASRLITVAQQGDADYRTIREALDAAEPDAVIRVLDDSTYDEGVSLTDASKSFGITIYSPAGAQWTAPEPRTVVMISNVPRVTVLGFKMTVKRMQHGIRYSGPCHGCRVERIQFNQPADSIRSFIVLDAGGRGLPEDPIVVSQVEGVVGGAGIVVIGDPGAPAGGLRVEQCRLSGRSKEKGVMVTMEKNVTDVEIVDNLFMNAVGGVSLEVLVGGNASRIRVAHNTFDQLTNWLSLGATSTAQAEIEFRDNLVVRSDNLAGDGQYLDADGRKWFRDNAWEVTKELLERNANAAMLAATVGIAVESAPLVSREPASPDYLRPAADFSKLLKPGVAVPGRRNFKSAK